MRVHAMRSIAIALLVSSAVALQPTCAVRPAAATLMHNAGMRQRAAVASAVADEEDVADKRPLDVSAVAGIAAAGTIKVATSVAVKATVTTATALVIGPALKAATIGASVVQIGVQRVREDRKKWLTSKLNETRIELAATAVDAQATELRLKQRREAADVYTSATSRAVARLPSGTTTLKRTMAFMLGFGMLGAVVPTALARKAAPLVILAALASRLVRRLDDHARNVAEERAGDLSVAAAERLEAEASAAEAAAKLRALQDANVYADMTEFNQYVRQ